MVDFFLSKSYVLYYRQQTFITTYSRLKTFKSLLGHNSLKTTEIYTDVAIDYEESIKNPFDNLYLKNKK